jgi:ABC-type uncharacterized transport system fused permease/ATPase subunit
MGEHLLHDFRYSFFVISGKENSGHWMANEGTCSSASVRDANQSLFVPVWGEFTPWQIDSDKQSDMPATAAALTAGLRLTPQMKIMFRVFLSSPQRTKLLLLGVAIVAVIGTTAFGQVRLNAWNQPFHNALTRKDLAEFFNKLAVFGVIAGALLVLNVAQAWLNQMAKVKLREGVVCDRFDKWLKPRRTFHLVNAGEIGAHPDQRIHEDARHLTELTTDLGVGLLQSSLLLGSLIGVLWILSQNVTFHMSGRSFGIPATSSGAPFSTRAPPHGSVGASDAH